MSAMPRVHAVHHRSDVGEWESFSRPPDPRLRGHVRGYEGYVEHRLGFRRRLEVPTRSVILIVNFGPGFAVTKPSGPGGTIRHASFVAGLHDSYVLVGSDGPARCLQVNLSPLAARLILGLPMHELANRTVGLTDVLGPQDASLADRLQETCDWNVRFAILDEFLLSRFSRARVPSPGVIHAWRTLLRSGGCADIRALAAEAGWSNKHLIDQCREQMGLPPKMLARVLRFNRVVRLVDRNGGAGWAAIAHECGYYDQAHLNRDFRRFAGTTPSAFLQCRIPHGGGFVGD